MAGLIHSGVHIIYTDTNATFGWNQVRLKIGICKDACKKVLIQNLQRIKPSTRDCKKLISCLWLGNLSPTEIINVNMKQ